MGLVSMSVPDEALEGKAVAVAAQLADRPPAAALDKTHAESLAAPSHPHLRCLASAR